MCNRIYKCIVNLKLHVRIQTTAPNFIQIANDKDREVCFHPYQKQRKFLSRSAEYFYLQILLGHSFGLITCMN